MKRKLWVLFATIVAAVALAFGISACSPFVQLPTQPQPLGTPVVSISDEGIASWEPVVHAVGYSYLIDDAAEVSTTARNVQLEDGQTIQVKATGDGSLYLDSAYSAPATYHKEPVPELTQLATPVVSIDEEGLATWEAVPNASGYQYKLNGGEEKTLESDAELQVQLQDKDSIQVKAVGDGETYSDSPYSAAKTYNAPAKPEPTQLATPEVTIDEDGLATWERVENATGYVCKVGGEEQEVQTELSIQLQSGDTLQVKAVSTDTEHFTESAYSDLQTYTKQPVEEKEKLLATFTLGDDNEENKEGTGQNGDTRGDGDASSSTTVTLHDTQNKYTLTLTDGANLYQKAWDNAGNGCLRLGSSKNVGKFTFIVPEGITKVVIYVAGYKSESTAVAYTINEKSSGTITVSKHSATPEYEAIEIIVSGTTEAERTLTFTTVKDVTGTKPRCKINTIEFWGEAIPELTKLDAPTLNVDSHTGDVTWEKVEGATSYTYTIDGENETTVGKDDELKVTLKNNQTITVIAKGDGTTYADSDPATKQYVHEHAYKTENNGWENDSDEGHYKKCTYCQEETEKTGHTYENGVCTECQYAHTDHKYSEEKPGECTVCHLKHTEHTYEDRNGKCHTCFAEHTGDDHVLATKTSSTHHWTECDVCGAKTAEIAHTHNTYGSDETQHWSVCECGATVPDTTEDHTYRNQNGKCDICEKEHATHDYGKSYISDDASGHHQVCTVCGNVSETVAHSTLQYTHDDDQHWQECPDCHWISGTKEGHTYNNEDQPDHCDKCGFDRNHVHQYTAWDSDDTYHWRYCPYHEGNKNFTDGKTLHQYDAAKGDGICTEENCKHAHSGHTFEQKHDQDNHWQECTTCYLKQSITAHSYDWKVSGKQHIHACTCGYQDVEGHTPNMQSVTTDPNNHWEKCEEEGCTITTENEKAPHTFVCTSISDEQHQEKCECGATHDAQSHTYKNGVCTNEECRHEHETHAYKWVAEGTTHNHQCTVCEKIETSHTATPDTEAGLKHEDGDTHWYTCKGAEGCDLHVNETEHDEGTVFVEKDDTNHTVQCVCGKVIKETEGHTYDGYEQTADGTKHYQQCTKCEHKTEETLHEFNETTAKPTNDEEQGNHYWECECGAKKTGEHAYDPETHKCKCGAIDPDVAKAEAALNAINFTALDYYEKVSASALPTTTLNSATVTWEVKEGQPEGYVKIEDNKLTILKLSTTGDVNVTITVKVTVGAVTKEKDYTLKLYQTTVHKGTADDPFSIADTKLLLSRLTNVGDYYEDETGVKEVYVKGIVTKDGAGSINGAFGIKDVYIGETKDTAINDAIYVFNINWDDDIMKTQASSPLSIGDEIIVRGYFKNHNGTQQITQNGQRDFPDLAYWLKASDRLEDLLDEEGWEIVELDLTTELAEGGDSVTWDFANLELGLPEGIEFTLTSGDEQYVHVEGNTLTALKRPESGTVSISVTATLKVMFRAEKGGKITYKEITSSTAIEVTVTPFDYETYLRGALDSIKEQLRTLALTKGETSGEIKLDAKYSDVTLEITGGSDDTIKLNVTDGGYTLQVVAESGTVTFNVKVTYNGIYSVAGSYLEPEQVEVTIVASDSPAKLLQDAYEELYKGNGKEELTLGGEGLTFTIDEETYSDIWIEVTEEPEAGVVNIGEQETYFSYTVNPSKLGKTTIKIELTYVGEGEVDPLVKTIEITVVPDLDAELEKFTQEAFTNLFGQFENDEEGYTLDVKNTIKLTEGIEVRYEFNPEGYISADGNTFTVTRQSEAKQVQIIVYVSYNGEEIDNSGSGKQIYVTVPKKDPIKGSFEITISDTTVTGGYSNYTWTKKSNDGKYTIGGNVYACDNQGMQFNKSTAYFYSDKATPAPISKITVEASYGTVEWTLYVNSVAYSGTSNPSSGTDCGKQTISTTSKGEWTITDSNATYFALVDTGAAQSKISKITVEYEQLTDETKANRALEALDLKGIDGKEFTAPTEEPQALPVAEGATTTWTMPESKYAKVENNQLTILSLPTAEEGQQDLTLSVTVQVGEYTTSAKTVTISILPEGSKEEEKLYTLTQTKGSNSNYASSGIVKCGDIEWNVEGNATTDPWRFGGKQITNTSRSLSGKTAIKGQVTQILITLTNSTSCTVNSVTLKVYSSDPTSGLPTAQYTRDIEYKKDTQVIVSAGSDEWKNCYFQIVFNVTCGKASSAKSYGNEYVAISELIFMGYSE